MAEVWKILKNMEYLINLWVTPAQEAMPTFQDQSHYSTSCAKTNKALPLLSPECEFRKLMVIFIRARASNTYVVHGSIWLRQVSLCLSFSHHVGVY